MTETMLIAATQYHLVFLAFRLLGSVTPDAKIAFPFSIGQARLRPLLACPSAGLGVLTPYLRRPRHSGPSHGPATLLRTLAEVTCRGPRDSDSTIRRCKKENPVARHLYKLPPPA